MKRFMVLLAVAAAAGPGGEKEAIHALRDGTLLQGTARIGEEEVRLETPFGVRVVPRSAYVGPTQASLAVLAEEYRQAAAAIETGDVPARRALAETCRSKGYLTGLRLQLDRILATDTEDRWARMILSRLAAQHRVHRFEDVREGRELRQYVDFLFEDLACQDNAGAVMAAEKLRALPEDATFGPAMKALRHDKPRVRWLGAHVLRWIPNQAGRASKLFKLSLQDGVWAVRREAVRALKASAEDASVADLYARQLGNPEQVLRLRAAQALGELAFEEGAAPLVAALQDAGSGRHDGYFASTTQTAYVKDYDVEVAQTAFIADPIVDVVQEGAVLDVGVISISIVRQVYRRALRRITGEDFGVDAGAWKAWLDRAGAARSGK